MKKTSDAGLRALMDEEGVVLHEYLDQIGKRTGGVGHLFGADEPRYCEPGCDWRKRPCSKGIPREVAFEWLRRDVGRVEDAIARNVRVPLNQNQYDALVGLVFNIGVGAFERSTLLRLLNAGDYAQAAAQFAVWRMGDGRVLPVLVARRARERALFERPVEGAAADAELAAHMADVRRWAFET